MYDLLRLGDKCNQECVFCFIPHGGKELTADEAMIAISNSIKTGHKNIVLTGGEPTIRKDLRNLVHFASSNGAITVGLQTNAERLSDMNYPKQLRQAGLDYVFISLHSHKKSVSEKITKNKGSFDRTVKGIQNSIQEGLIVDLSFVICEPNYKEIPEYVDFVNSISKDIGIEFSFILPNFPGPDKRKLIPKLSNLKPYLKKAIERCVQHKTNFRFGSCSLPLCSVFPHILKSEEFNEMKKITTDKNYLKQLNEKTSKLGVNSESRGYFLWKHQKIKSEKCQSCALNNYCNGVWRGYADVYGLDDLEPITDLRELTKLKLSEAGENK